MPALSFTLYPDGAFLQCESVSEFDPNMQPPAYSAAVVTQVKADTQDPVNKLPIVLRPLYDTVVKPIMAMDYSVTGAEAVAMLDDLGCKVTAISDMLYKCLMSQQAANNLYCNTSESYTNMSYNAHAGIIIKNMNRIKEQGYDSFSWTVSDFERIDVYFMSQLFGVLNANSKMLDNIITTKDIDNMLGSSRFTEIFPDIQSIVNCLLINDELRCRLEKDDIRETRLNGLISRGFYSGCVAEDPGIGHEKAALLFLSKSLKCIKGEIYDIQLDIIDNMDESVQHDRIRKVMCRTLNMFNILTLYIFAEAYTIRRSKNYKDALDAFIEKILNMLKTAK